MFKELNNPENGEQKLTIAEKLVIRSGVVLFKSFLNKFKKAKTYQDISDLMDKGEELLGDTDGNPSTEAGITKMLKDIESKLSKF